jgi:P27 family predicted phage terminase small subunit
MAGNRNSGRRRQPAAAHRLAGTYRRDRHGAARPAPPAKVPGMPAWLSREAKAEWRRVSTELLALGLLTVIDRAALAAYCQAFAELMEATRMLEREGRIVDQDVMNKDGVVTGSVKKLHPAVRLQRDAFARVKAYLGEFGLTPSSRARLPAAEKPKAADPFEDFLRGRTSLN